MFYYLTPQKFKILLIIFLPFISIENRDDGFVLLIDFILILVFLYFSCLLRKNILKHYDVIVFLWNKGHHDGKP